MTAMTTMTRLLTRRSLLTNLARATAVAAIGNTARAALGQAGYGPRPNAQRPNAPGPYINGFARQFRVPATSTAISKQGRFVFDHAGGTANGQHLTPAQQDSLFRIADLSKPVTAVTIFSLIEAGKLNLSDTIFGAHGILGMKYAKPSYSQFVTEVTVDHLLTHTAGGWGAGDNDPMFHNNGWDQLKLT